MSLYYHVCSSWGKEMFEEGSHLATNRTTFQMRFCSTASLRTSFYVSLRDIFAREHSNDIPIH